MGILSSKEKGHEDDNGVVGLTVLSWNIAGLHPYPVERATHIGDRINNLGPDVVLLQEVISTTLPILKKKCTQYHFTDSSLVNYFNVVMTKKRRFKGSKEIMHKFEGSCMGRYLLVVETQLASLPLAIMASHLESLENFSEERKTQLQSVFTQMQTYSASHAVVFGGDTNLREHECGEIGGVPEGICDVWESRGSDESMKMTKVVRKEDDLSLVKRYDRVYYGAREGFSCTKFERIGNERIEQLGLFPSDHLGILVEFSLQ